jgi:hypothetical protein
MKPATSREAMSKHLTRVPGVVGDGAWGKICGGTWEALLGGPKVNAMRESITVSGPEGGGEARSSEEVR